MIGLGTRMAPSASDSVLARQPEVSAATAAAAATAPPVTAAQATRTARAPPTVAAAPAVAAVAAAPVAAAAAAPAARTVMVQVPRPPGAPGPIGQPEQLAPTMTVAVTAPAAPAAAPRPPGAASPELFAALQLPREQYLALGPVTLARLTTQILALPPVTRDAVQDKLAADQGAYEIRQEELDRIQTQSAAEAQHTLILRGLEELREESSPGTRDHRAFWNAALASPEWQEAVARGPSARYQESVRDQFLDQGYRAEDAARLTAYQLGAVRSGQLDLVAR